MEQNISQPLSSNDNLDINDTNTVSSFHIKRNEINLVESFCTRSYKTNCQRCLYICPHNALSMDTDNIPKINRDRCTNCGLCRGVCDAFVSERITYDDLVEKVKKIDKNYQVGNIDIPGIAHTPIYFTCAEHVFSEETPAFNVVTLPCLASLPPEFWTILLREGYEVILQIDFDFCSTCFCAGENALNHITHIISLAEEWTKKTVQISETYPLEGNIWDVLSELNSDDRRILASQLAAEGLDIASGDYRRRSSHSAIQEYEEKRERMRARGLKNLDKGIGLSSLKSKETKKLERPRQVKLVESVNKYPKDAQNIKRWFAITNPYKCDLCGKCVTQCPTDARSIQNETDFARTDPKRCIACGACIDACPNFAIDFIEGSASWLNENKQNDTDQ